MGGRTPLHLAAEKGNQAIVEILLKQCADYNAKDGLGKTPLHWAFQGNYGGVIKTLLSVGADSTIRDFSGKLAGDCASNPEVKNILGGNQVIGRVRSESMEKSAHLMVLQVPVPHDPKINLRDGDGFTQLCRAAMNGHKKEVEALILLGADIDEVDTKERRTPLGWAVEKNYMDVMELLIAKGANINVADRHEETPLIAASGKGHREAVAVLLAHNADFRIRKKSGLTALSYAVFHGQIGIVEVFINHGVDLVKEENLALHDAVGAWRISDLHCKKIVELLISKGLDINAVNRDGCTLLHRWAGSYDSCNEQVLELLLAYGLDINRGDNIGNTPLHETVRGGGHGSGTKKKIELLIRHGANVNKINNGGNAPLHIAVQWDSSMTMKIVELLIKNGADAKMKNKEGKLPIECAKGELVREVLKKHTDTCVVC
jgi:ankyrin repeat protein